MESLNPTQILASATEFLEAAHYKRVEVKEPTAIVSSARIFEDPYSVVALSAYATWESLWNAWIDLQAGVVDLISSRLTRDTSKAWDGYLVLITPAQPTGDGTSQLERLRRDTQRLRKLVGTGDDVKTVSGVRKILFPLLPLTSDVKLAESTDALERLPSLLRKGGIDEGATRSVVRAFQLQEPLLQALVEYQRQK